MRGATVNWSDLVIENWLTMIGNKPAENLLIRLVEMQRDQIKWEHECLPSYWWTKDVDFDPLYVMSQMRHYWIACNYYDQISEISETDVIEAEKRLRRKVVEMPQPPPPLEVQLKRRKISEASLKN